jgi:hypothetical protein
VALKRPDKNKSNSLKEPIAPATPKEKEHLTFSLRYLRPSHCISNCNTAEKAALVEKIRILTTMSWMAIGMEQKHGLGYEKIPQSQLKVAMPAHLTPEENILALRFSGLKPMLGYKDKEGIPCSLVR